MSQTVIAALEAMARAQPARTAFARKEGGRWRETSFAEYLALVRHAARGFMALGVGPGRNVAILSANRPEWFLASLGAMATGAVAAGIYTTSSPEQCEYIAHHAEAAVVVLENEAFLAAFLPLRARLPHLRTIVLLQGHSAEPGVITWEELKRRGDSVAEADLAARTAALHPDSCACLIYTSGTTGPPKAVMLSHESVLWVSPAIARILGVEPGDRGLSYLPMAHVAEQNLSLFGPIAMGYATYFAESMEKVPENLREVRPTFFFGVPRVWEKMQARIEAGLLQVSPRRRVLLGWARRLALRAGYAAQEGRRAPLLFPLVRALVLAKVREKLGLDRARICIVSAAPMSRGTLDFFLGLDIPILEIYGMSECAGPATVSLPTAYRTGRAGRALPGSEIKVAEDGEILIRGPHVFLGYFKDEAATSAVKDADGYLHSGDVGELDAASYLKVTDRKKELLVTSGGKKTGPALLEARLKQLPGVAQAVVVGDGRHYLSALFTLDPLRVKDVASEAGSPARDSIEAAACPLFRSHLERALVSANAHFARSETIKRFALLPHDFSVEGGELTPTLKLKRRIIYEKYRAEIERLYA